MSKPILNSISHYGDEVNKVENKKIKYDAKYIAYVEHGESAAVFITRDVVNTIDTKGKWVDVLNSNGEKNKDNKWDFEWIEVELFPRKTHPVYPPSSTDEEKKYITWQTAHQDIQMLREKGYHGTRYRIYLKLVNENKGKTKTVKKVWNRVLQQYVKRTHMTPSCEVKTVKIPLEPKWEYHVLSTKKM